MTDKITNGRVEIYFGPGYHQGETFWQDARRAIAKASKECFIPIGPLTNHPAENPGGCEMIFGCDYAYYEFIGDETGMDPRAQEFVDQLNAHRGICAKLIEMEPDSSKEIHEKTEEEWMARTKRNITNAA